ncbi:hypothetical protein DFH09DRAFT_1101750 [Mycena vulgaris]|nr:hypothetical protein DFH09DRAFT_1103836 [Mycena vulgaris]KAJ6504954.1 hypothetical protein DFH09DRAFT_1101750 [Mycena vulgaris]
MRDITGDFKVGGYPLHGNWVRSGRCASLLVSLHNGTFFRPGALGRTNNIPYVQRFSLQALMQRRKSFLLRLTLFSALTPFVAATISLSCPTANVVQGTSVDCAWTAIATDPETFSLVMQFSNLGPPFGQSSPVKNVTRGGKTSDTLPDIKNVGTLGLHRLAARDAGLMIGPRFSPLQASSVSPAFLVVANSSSLSTSRFGTTTSPPFTSTTNLGAPTTTPTSSRSGTSLHTITAVVVSLCAALAVGILATAIFVHRRRRVRTHDFDLLGGEPLLTVNGRLNGANNVLDAPGGNNTPRTSSAPSAASRRTKAAVVPKIRGPRLQDDVLPLGTSSAPTAAPKHTKAAVVAEMRGPRPQDDVPPPAYFSV